VRALAHDIVVTQNGKVVEQGPAAEILDNPRQTYTRRLITAALELRSPSRSKSDTASTKVAADP